jgi:hypothetical protein
MKKYRRKKVRVDWAQQKMLECVRIELAGEGYLIFPVAKAYRYHRLDFVAVLKVLPNNFLVVRPTPGGRISFTPFGPHGQYIQADRAIAHARRAIDIAVIWSPRPFRAPPPGKAWWEEYVPKKFWDELRILLKPVPKA